MTSCYGHLANNVVCAVSTRRYRQPVWRNGVLCGLWALFFGFVSFLLLAPPDTLTETFHIASTQCVSSSPSRVVAIDEGHRSIAARGAWRASRASSELRLSHGGCAVVTGLTPPRPLNRAGRAQRREGPKPKVRHDITSPRDPPTRLHPPPPGHAPHAAGTTATGQTPLCGRHGRPRATRHPAR
jgi:hypothetical protein